MKKRLNIVCILLCIVMAAAMLMACAAPGAPMHDVSAPKYVATESGDICTDITAELDAFLDANPDRTTFNAGELKAAEYLQSRLTEFGYSDVALQEFTLTENNVSGLVSHNVIAKLPAAVRTDNTKNVVLGAYYDNRYSSSYENADSIKAEAALAGGSSVATLLAISKYLINNASFDYDVTIVFFGAAYIYVDGAREYLRNGMTVDERRSTVLMVELQRLGVDHVYAYSDARETKREGFFDCVASENGLDIYKPTQKSPIITSATATEGVPYFQWAHSGVFTVFANAGIPTLNLVGANWETMNLGDAESAVNPDIAYTSSDNRETLVKYYPDYAKKAGAAATLVIRSLEHAEFLQTVTYDKEHFPDTAILNANWIWSLVVLGVLVIAALITYLVYRRLNKKYKPTPVKPRRMKMAVFGMDYEDKNSADIFLDFQSSANEEIFPGVPNNDKSTKSNIDGIFPPASDGRAQSVAPPEQTKTSDITTEQPIEQSAAQEQNDDRPDATTEITPAAEDEKTVAGSEQSELISGEQAQHSSNAAIDDEVYENENGDKPAAAKRKREPKIEIVQPTAKKRSTVSAKKSTGASKSATAGMTKKSDKPKSDKKSNDDKE